MATAWSMPEYRNQSLVFETAPDQEDSFLEHRQIGSSGQVLRISCEILREKKSPFCVLIVARLVTWGWLTAHALRGEADPQHYATQYQLPIRRRGRSLPRSDVIIETLGNADGFGRSASHLDDGCEASARRTQRDAGTHSRGGWYSRSSLLLHGIAIVGGVHHLGAAPGRLSLSPACPSKTLPNEIALERLIHLPPRLARGSSLDLVTASLLCPSS